MSGGGHGRVPPQTAELSDPVNPEGEKVVFSFEMYNNSECEIADLTKPDARKLTGKLQEISSATIADFNRSYVRGSISPSDKRYKLLFNTLPNDSRLLEAKFSKPGRIFGYLVRNIFSVVAICIKHK